MIEPYGAITPLPQAGLQPDPSLSYRLVIDVVRGTQEPTELNPGLNHVARTLNLFEAAGIPPEQLDVIAIVHSAATRSVLSNEAYRARFGCENPTLPLIRQLHGAGVLVAVCGQALLGNDCALDEVADEVTVALSALTTLATCQLRGYALIPQ